MLFICRKRALSVNLSMDSVLGLALPVAGSEIIIHGEPGLLKKTRLPLSYYMILSLFQISAEKFESESLKIFTLYKQYDKIQP